MELTVAGFQRKILSQLNCPKKYSCSKLSRRRFRVTAEKKTIEKVRVVLRRNVLIVKAVKAGVVTISRKP